MEHSLGRAPDPDAVIAELARQFSAQVHEGQIREAEWIKPEELWSRAYPDGLSDSADVLPRRGRPDTAGPKPPWLKRPLPGGPVYARLRQIMDTRNLHTVCESARCPNLGECWGRGTATFMILGDTCTRYCGFCAVASGKPGAPDLFEPARVADAVRHMALRHVVITSVNRDDLPDGGADIWAQTIRAVRRKNPETRIEVLIPDLMGNWNALQDILDAGPDVLNHNLETVPRLYPAVRPQARFGRSLELLRRAKSAGFRTKTGLMLGIGEHPFEIFQTLRIISEESVDILTLGQYLRPAPKYLPVDRWVHPAEFAHWKRIGDRLGFRHVESGPLVRSSYHADAIG
ncbi:lipoyl synthase [bacterium]|nr:lipoyl synthase [bacterium]